MRTSGTTTRTSSCSECPRAAPPLLRETAGGPRSVGKHGGRWDTYVTTLHQEDETAEPGVGVQLETILTCKDCGRAHTTTDSETWNPGVVMHTSGKESFQTAWSRIFQPLNVTCSCAHCNCKRVHQQTRSLKRVADAFTITMECVARLGPGILPSGWTPRSVFPVSIPGSSQSTTFRLAGVVTYSHHHYKTYVAIQPRWHCLDGEFVTPVSFQTVPGKNAYIYLYKKVL